MNRLKIKFRALRTGAVLPEYATPGSAAMDLRACLDAPVTLAPGSRALIPTGLAMSLPSPDCAAFIFARSGLAVKRGICLANGVGVIDSDYRGELQVGLLNTSGESFTVSNGDRIAQLAVLPVCIAAAELCDELDTTDRGEGGFGSTGTR